MAINPLDPAHRQRLSRSVDYSYQELYKYNLLRAHTIRAYLGINGIFPEHDWIGENPEYERSLPKGNLLQLAGIGHQIALAYGEPQWMATPRTPEHTAIAERMQPAINRMATLLNLGETYRNVAADSFFGYGVFKVGIGYLPLSAQQATGLQVGPCVWRVSQKDFIYDITAKNWESCQYQGDLYTMGVEDAVALYPEHADRLRSMVDHQYSLQAPTVTAREVRDYAPQEEVQLLDVYFPAAKLVCTWPVRSNSFMDIAEEPIAVREWTGHWSGLYEVLNHLYCPDEIVPVSQAESVKALHILFNDLLELTSNQAREAKYNPTYRAGSDQDMKRLWEADDRAPVSVTNPDNFGNFEIPGPTQSQTAYMMAMQQLFKQMNFNLDQRLGLAQTAETATQAQIQNAAGDQIISEMKRKALRSLQLVGYKLAHLILNDKSLSLPATRPVRPGSEIDVDVSWVPLPPGSARVDDFDIAVDPFSTSFRTPQQRLATINQLMPVLLQVAQMQMQGMPVSFPNTLSIFAKYSGEDELRSIFEPADPEYAAAAQNSRQEGTASALGKPNGEYTRRNVSQRDGQGEMMQALSQFSNGDAEARNDE